LFVLTATLKRLNPYPPDYRAAFAFSVLLYPLRRPRPLRFGYHTKWDTTGLPS